ncbi:MAG: M48 family metallopeptidase [Gammaproteobacteria bacterium]|nr:M48 family metallopeptidase [Gammaproteobacteria bacterium]
MQQHQQVALPFEFQEYTIRESKRAKKLQLSVSPIGKVEVIVPAGMDHRQIPVFVARHRTWIKQSLRRIHQQRSSVLDAVLPQQIVFSATQQQWQVSYLMGSDNHMNELAGSNVTGVNAGEAINPGLDDCYLLQLSIKNEHYALSMLSDWLTEKARQILTPWMQDLSRETGLAFNSVAVRAQKTRWGSCSSKKSINLNRALLFLEPELVRYVLVHELCHTRHLNHSALYWALVEYYEPNYKTLDTALNKATYLIPRWAYPQ